MSGFRGPAHNADHIGSQLRTLAGVSQRIADQLEEANAGLTTHFGPGTERSGQVTGARLTALRLVDDLERAAVTADALLARLTAL